MSLKKKVEADKVFVARATMVGALWRSIWVLTITTRRTLCNELPSLRLGAPATNKASSDANLQTCMAHL